MRLERLYSIKTPNWALETPKRFHHIDLWYCIAWHSLSHSFISSLVSALCLFTIAMCPKPNETISGCVSLKAFYLKMCSNKRSSLFLWIVRLMLIFIVFWCSVHIFFSCLADLFHIFLFWWNENDVHSRNWNEMTI